MQRNQLDEVMQLIDTLLHSYIIAQIIPKKQPNQPSYQLTEHLFKLLTFKLQENSPIKRAKKTPTITPEPLVIYWNAI